MKKKPSSHQTPKCYKVHDYELIEPKKNLDMFTLSVLFVVRKDFSHEPFHDQQPGYFNS